MINRQSWKTVECGFNWMRRWRWIICEYFKYKNILAITCYFRKTRLIFSWTLSLSISLCHSKRLAAPPPLAIFSTNCRLVFARRQLALIYTNTARCSVSLAKHQRCLQLCLWYICISSFLVLEFFYYICVTLWRAAQLSQFAIFYWAFTSSFVWHCPFDGSVICGGRRPYVSTCGILIHHVQDYHFHYLLEDILQSAPKN